MGMQSKYQTAWAQVIWQVFCPPVGATLIFCLKPDQIKAIPLGLAFAAGVLIWIAMLGMHVESLESFTSGIEPQFEDHFEDRWAWLPRFSTLCSMIGGMLGGAIIDYLAHKIGGGHDHDHSGHHSNPHITDKVGPNFQHKTKDNLNMPERVMTNEQEEEDEIDVNFNITPNRQDLEMGDVENKENLNKNGYSTGNQEDDDENIQEDNTQDLDELNETNEQNNEMKGTTTTITKLNSDTKVGITSSQPEITRSLSKKQEKELEHASIVNFMAIVLHNLPEGLSIFTATVADPKLGALVAVAFALHEFPFGISVAMPIFFSTGSRAKAIWWAFLCGTSMVVGGGIANIIIDVGGNLHNNTTGFIFGFVAGLMLWVSYRELLPQARGLDPEGKYVTPLLFSGFLIMDIVFVIFDGTGGHSHESDDGHNHRRRRARSLLSRLF